MVVWRCSSYFDEHIHLVHTIPPVPYIYMHPHSTTPHSFFTSQESIKQGLPALSRRHQLLLCTKVDPRRPTKGVSVHETLLHNVTAVVRQSTRISSSRRCPAISSCCPLSGIRASGAAVSNRLANHSYFLHFAYRRLSSHGWCPMSRCLSGGSSCSC